MSQTESKPLFQETPSTILLLIGAGVLYAIALKYFVLPSKVILTGTEGIAASISYYFEKDWLFITLYMLFQAGILVFAFKGISVRFGLRSLVVIASVIIVLAILPELKFAKPEPENERIILVIFGGLLAGVAKAMAFQRGGSTGDEDVFGAYFATKYLKPVGYIAIISATISTLFGMSLTLLKTHQLEPTINTLIYTSIYIFVSSEALNNFYKKFQISLVTIVTQEPEKAAKAIQAAAIHRTYTVDQEQGGYSQESYWVVKTLVTHEELPDIVEAIEQHTPSSFYYHHNVEGVSSQYYIKPIGT